MSTSSQLQKLAQKENWALFLLVGMRSANRKFIRPVVHSSLYEDLDTSIDYCIGEIKGQQYARLDKKVRKAK